MGSPAQLLKVVFTQLLESWRPEKPARSSQPPVVGPTPLKGERLRPFRDADLLLFMVGFGYKVREIGSEEEETLWHFHHSLDLDFEVRVERELVTRAPLFLEIRSVYGLKPELELAEGFALMERANELLYPIHVHIEQDTRLVVFRTALSVSGGFHPLVFHQLLRDWREAILANHEMLNRLIT